ncbi:MAG: ribosomal RNA small subunit methyltransferase A [Candidatus Moranbacteria bacterium]|nr:ribosomal RNA small subunit methyltransferase A [Candidatus Moranbacteria bacterium]OIQ03121.1 MAG: ribosomal RNA small subunit methyltransferase A [Candidatus Moranbacteria bacterium CG2_30_41_165]PIP25467.1 MAG: ribosomal RNA small subunit methyltransferase A [Candidatus Moranbacteria bacterium CG23_combo_of_CG06-09_8_20_14_all_41_28]PIV86056.1 MAG: ribosomal RNA small subunit methyltransferase A [Candidatus Moranbacteria bacterium CG17_big_fil_post_rev_8_21_14_2_50_41_107]PIW94536.1 MAG: 
MSIKAKKSLGQNFLKDETVIENILALADVQPTDWVFEIGPGTGVLTSKLVERAEKVMAIELDHELVLHLTERFNASEGLSLLEGNILDMNLKEVLEVSQFSEHPYKIIANIPYYITAPIIRTLLSLPYQPVSMTLMVQDEVADRLSAQAGSMSLLSLMAQYYATVEKKLFVSKESFEPAPKVDSAVISIIPRRAYDKEEDRKVFRLARAGFSARRKTLVNNLSSSLNVSKEMVEAKLAELGLRSDIRAQALSTDDWENLQKIF